MFGIQCVYKCDIAVNYGCEREIHADSKNQFVIFVVVGGLSVVFFPGLYFSFALELPAHGRISTSVQN